jgi:outer membrane lipoprotein-sorting protein
MKKIIPTIILWSGVILAVETGLTGKEILTRVKKATVAKDRLATAIMTITDRNGRKQTRTIQFTTKGDKKLMATFQEPPDLSGVTFMTTSSENMWIYLPAQARVRRISGSMVNQGFGGSDFSYKEMNNISSVAEDKDVEKVEETIINDKTAYLLTLKESEGLINRLWVDKRYFIPVQLEKLNQAGNVIKRIEFKDFAQEDSIWIPKLIQLQDLNNGSRTEIKVTEFQINTGIKDNWFTESNMKRGKR